MNLDIIDIAEKEAKEITKIVLEKYEEVDFDVDTLMIEKEIYERALHYATVFYINNSEAKFDEGQIKSLDDYLQIKLENPKVIKKMTMEDKLAHTVKIFVINFLLEWKGIVIA